MCVCRFTCIRYARPIYVHFVRKAMESCALNSAGQSDLSVNIQKLFMAKSQSQKSVVPNVKAHVHVYTTDAAATENFNLILIASSQIKHTTTALSTLKNMPTAKLLQLLPKFS